MEINRITELSIGNIILVNKVPRKIVQITRKKIGYYTTKDKHHLSYANLTEIEPVKLTEELFEKIGFERYVNIFVDYDYFYWPVDGYDKLTIYIQPTPSNNYAIVSEIFGMECDVEIKYLHQLQQVMSYLNIKFNPKLNIYD